MKKLRMLYYRSAVDSYVWLTFELETDADDYCEPGYHFEEETIVTGDHAALVKFPLEKRWMVQK